MTQDGLFTGFRVLDLSQGIGGAYATKLLADQGADVLKVEDPENPDPLRRETACGAALPASEDSALFRFLNAGKRSAALPGSAALLELASEADVVIESFAPGAPAGPLGDPEALRGRFPRLSTVSISPWGRTGPYADRPATEWTLQAGSGFMARRGRPELGHIGAGGRLGEYSAGAFAAVAALACWREARGTGQGRNVDVSMFEAMLICSTQYWDLDSQMRGGKLPQYLDIPAVEPAKDGWVGFAPQTSEQWKSFCLLIERPEIAEDDRYLTSDLRQTRLDFLHDAIHSWTRERTIDEILELCEALRIPASPIGNGELLPGVDHFVARGVFVENPHGFTQPRTPYSLSACERRAVRAAPAAGADESAWLPRADTARADTAPAAGALVGLQVADLTAFWAGPFTTNVMALLGADVVKVESIGHPDGMRFVNAKPDVPIWEGGAIFHGANPQKRGTTLALDREEGRALLRRLVERSDLLVENFSPRVLSNFGLEPETLLAWNPRLIVVRMPAWGLDGPWCNRTGFAMNVEQASGIAWRAGYGSQPLTANFCDPVGSLHALVAVFAALEHRDRTGAGQIIEVPLVEPALNLAAEQMVEHSAYGARLDSEGNRNRRHAPQGIYRCRDDRFLTLAVRSDAEWSELGRVLRELSDVEAAVFADPALATLAQRRERHDEIDAAIEQMTAALPVADVVAALCAAGVPAETLINGFDLMPHPQLIAREFYQVLAHPLTGSNRYSGLPFVGLADGLPTMAPPTLGQHNREVLEGELGVSAAELRDLEEKGVVGTRPPWAQAPADE